MTTAVLESPGIQNGDWRVVVHSLGNAGAGLLQALRHLSPLPESRLAELLYQGPSELAAGLDRDSAEKINGLLVSAGLESRVLAAGDAFEPGGADHEVAVVVQDPRRMADAARLAVEILGVTLERARQILCSSPAVLIGRISANTAQAIARRFTALDGVEADVSRSSAALFDVFLGGCEPADRARACRILRDLGHAVEEASGQPLLAAGLSHDEADRLWQQLSRGPFPVRVLNRDFERFDVRLDQAPGSPEMLAFLAESTGMPPEVAGKVVANVPIVTHQNVSFRQLAGLLERFEALGARASGQLLAFQSFALDVRKVGDRRASVHILQALAGLDEDAAEAALRTARRIDGPLTRPQASWLQWELRQAGTEASLVLR